MTNLADNYQNKVVLEKKTQTTIRTLYGPHSYMIGSNGQKRHTDRDKVTLHTDIWKQLYLNDDDDDDHNDYTWTYMTNNIHGTTPFETADAQRLKERTQLNSIITSEDMKYALKRSKASGSGSNLINKTILSHLPDAAME